MSSDQHNSTVLEVKPSQFTSYRDYLEALYLRRKHDDVRYSYARFALDLGLPDASVAHHIVKGKRKLTTKAAQKITLALSLTGIERQYFQALVELGNAATADDRDEVQRKVIDLRTRAAPSLVDKDRLAFLADWYHPVILDLFASRPHATAEWLAETLIPNVRVDLVRKSIDLLVRLGLLAHDAASGRHVPTQTTFTVPEGVTELAAARYLTFMIDLGKEALGSCEPDRRHVTSMSIRVRADQMAVLKQKIRDFNAEIAAMEASPSETDAVYNVSVQMFPLAEISEAKESSDDVA